MLFHPNFLLTKSSCCKDLSSRRTPSNCSVEKPSGPSPENKGFECRILEQCIAAAVVIIHQRRGYLGEWANADKIDLLVLLLNFRIVRRKVKLLEIDALERSDGVDEHPTSDTLP
jgi:hypothetical protein